MFYLVEFPDTTLGIYHQKHVSHEKGTACLVKHKGSKYEASVISQNGSIEVLTEMQLQIEGSSILSDGIVGHRIPPPQSFANERESRDNHEMKNDPRSSQTIFSCGKNLVVELVRAPLPEISSSICIISDGTVEECQIHKITDESEDQTEHHILNNTRPDHSTLPNDESPVDDSVRTLPPLAESNRVRILSNEIIKERRNQELETITKGEETQALHNMRKDIQSNITFPVLELNVTSSSVLPLVESGDIRILTDDIIKQHQMSEPDFSVDESQMIITHLHKITDIPSEECGAIVYPHEKNSTKGTDLYLDQLICRNLNDSSSSSIIVSNIDETIEFQSMNQISTNMSYSSGLEELGSESRRISSNSIMNGTYIFSFDCQPGEIIDLDSTKVTRSPYPPITNSSTPNGVVEVPTPLPSTCNGDETFPEESESENETHDDYIPGKDDNLSDTTDSDQKSRDENELEKDEEQKKNNSSQNSLSFLNRTGLQPCDENQMYVQKSRGRNGDQKSNFCFYCHKKQRKLARHLELKHKTEEDVKKFIDLPKKSMERRKVIEIIRKNGNYIFNTNKDFNDGELIVSRRPNTKFTREADHYIACGSCKAFFAKNTLRWHYKKCNKTSNSKSRSVLVMSKRVMGRIHPKATEIVRKQLFPLLREDEVVRAIRYDELVIIYANKMVEKYKNTRHFEMIRQRLRLLGRFIITMRGLDAGISDLISVFDPKYIDITTNAINIEAKLKIDHLYETPTVAFSLGTLLKQLGTILVNECIKQHKDQKKIDTENFLKLLAQEVLIGINRTVAESQFQIQRRKPTLLPALEDIKKLHNHLAELRRDAFNQLENGFSYGAWIKLAEATLSSVQLFNRRRAGEVERILIEDFLSYQSLNENTDKDLFHSLSKESQEIARKYVRFAIRGKLNRNVPVLLDHTLLKCMQLILQHRKYADVPDTNPYVFGIRSLKKMGPKYLRSCALMRKFAENCGAQHPDRLRGTKLRKHIATTCITLNLSENEISDLANFMGHRESIHKNFYRQPLVNREILKMSKLLEAAQGANSVDSDDDSSGNEQDEVQPGVSSSPASIQNSGEKRKKRSTSPYGNVKRKKWSEQEKTVVLSAYSEHIKRRTLPSLADIQNLIVENPCLKQRHSAQIKTWIHNQYKNLGS